MACSLYLAPGLVLRKLVTLTPRGWESFALNLDLKRDDTCMSVQLILVLGIPVALLVLVLIMNDRTRNDCCKWSIRFVWYITNNLTFYLCVQILWICIYFFLNFKKSKFIYRFWYWIIYVTVWCGHGVPSSCWNSKRFIFLFFSNFFYIILIFFIVFIFFTPSHIFK